MPLQRYPPGRGTHRTKMTDAVRRSLLLVALALSAGIPMLAQRGGGGPGGGGMGGGGMQRGGPPFGSSPFPNTSPMPGGIHPNGHGEPPQPRSSTGSTNSSMRGGLQLGPPGRFWDDKDFAKNLGLRKDQQKKMDAIFDANRSALVENYRTLQVEEKRLERITKERPLDEGRVFAGIDAVVQARGALEKTNAHMLLQIRGEMDNDQVTRMDKFREEIPQEAP